MFAGKPFAGIVESQLATEETQEIFGISPIEYCKPGFQADRAAISPQENIGHGVKGATADLLAAETDQESDPAEHFLGGFSGKGQE